MLCAGSLLNHDVIDSAYLNIQSRRFAGVNSVRIASMKYCSGVTGGRGRGQWTSPGDTLQGGDTQMKKNVAEFTKNSGQWRSDR